MITAWYWLGMLAMGMRMGASDLVDPDSEKPDESSH
jgi:hypothetical protein